MNVSGWVSLESGRIEHAWSLTVPHYTPNQKGMEGLGGKQPLKGEGGEGEALGHFSDLATHPLMTHHSPFRILQLGSHPP